MDNRKTDGMDPTALSVGRAARLLGVEAEVVSLHIGQGLLSGQGWLHSGPFPACQACVVVLNGWRTLCLPIMLPIPISIHAPVGGGDVG